MCIIHKTTIACPCCICAQLLTFFAILIKIESSNTRKYANKKMTVRKRLKRFCVLRRLFFANMKKHVIIASSDDSLLDDLGGIIRLCGYEVDGSAGDGIDAIMLAEKYMPQLCFLDESLGTVDACSVARTIKSRNRDCLCFVLCEKYESKAQDNIDGFIVKPVTEKFLGPWLATKIARMEGISSIIASKDEIMTELSEKRIMGEAEGKIAETSGISLEEARKVLSEKASKLGITEIELAKKIAGKD